MTDDTSATRTAWHEAGHVAAHLAYGLRFRYVTTRARGPHVAGRVACRPVRVDTVTQMVILHAGPIAQGRYEFNNLPADHLADEGLTQDDVITIAYLDGGGNDHAIIRDCLAELGVSAGGSLDLEVENTARDLLNRKWPIVEQVAAALIERRTLTYREVLDLPGVAEGWR